MSSSNLGNQVNQIVRLARVSMFDQGELAQLTYGAFDIAARSMQSMEQDEIEVTFPIGYKPDKTTIPSTRTYRKEQLLAKYQYLAFHQLTVNALVQLVTLVETMLGDVVRAIVARYPQNLEERELSLYSLCSRLRLWKRCIFVPRIPCSMSCLTNPPWNSQSQWNSFCP